MTMAPERKKNIFIFSVYGLIIFIILLLNIRFIKKSQDHPKPSSLFEKKLRSQTFPSQEKTPAQPATDFKSEASTPKAEGASSLKPRQKTPRRTYDERPNSIILSN